MYVSVYISRISVYNWCVCVFVCMFHFFFFINFMVFIVFLFAACNFHVLNTASQLFHHDA